MKKEFVTNNSKFVYSKNELGYQEVLDDFENASEITIITYNISEKKNLLITSLRKFYLTSRLPLSRIMNTIIHPFYLKQM